MGFVNIFGQGGGASVYDLADNTKPLIAISTVTDGKQGPKLYMANAPTSGIRIQRLTDHSINKSLGGDFLINVFGDTPDDIQLSGLNFFAYKCGDILKTAEYDDIMDFYDQNKVSTDRSKRIDVTIANSGTDAKKPGQVFRCALIKLTAQSSSEPDFSNVLYTYTLSLVGVAKK